MRLRSRITIMMTAGTAVIAAMAGHVRGKAVYTGLYKRP